MNRPAASPDPANPATILELKRVLARLRAKPEWEHELSDDCNLVTDLVLDSIEVLQFMLEVEGSMGRVIDFEHLEYSHLESLTAFARFIDRAVDSN